MRGSFITFEGVEGAGKTSIIEKVYELLQARGFKTIKTREPGGIEIAEKIRNVILDRSHTNMDGRTEALLYAAARRQHLVERVLPKLNEGYIVLCDRFIDSSLAYQGYARELGMDEVRQINEFAIQSCMPDLTLLLDINPQKGMERIWENKEREQNRLDLEGLNFHHKVYEGYQLLLKQFPNRIKRVDADQSLDEVLQSCMSYLEKHVAK
ncbi:dTMP kinase [Salinibacillus xinjiangensis]|uniref:Thymidylate kinase n=1 Tax=Salinibacillus xinjiangensis TaxID=1229268 RepID=A0A6G1XAW5_9BACI|nr:dTMP kinase [Salinibacillus xinjiangensis]MRG88153.1 dTMP kinase [Salinibacillus xinjiangensis]